MLLVDTLFYGHIIVTPINFLRVNVLDGVSSLYGENPALWYIFAALPLIMGPLLPVLVYGIYRSTHRILICLCAFHIAALSCISHKELRFLCPILPILFAYCGQGLADLAKQMRRRTFIGTFCLLAAINILLGIYFGVFHQAGVIGVVRHLAVAAEPKSTLVYLMPCHSTPFYSAIHKRVDMFFLTCEPAIVGCEPCSTYGSF